MMRISGHLAALVAAAVLPLLLLGLALVLAYVFVHLDHDGTPGSATALAATALHPLSTWWPLSLAAVLMGSPAYLLLTAFGLGSARRLALVGGAIGTIVALMGIEHLSGIVPLMALLTVMATGAVTGAMMRWVAQAVARPAFGVDLLSLTLPNLRLPKIRIPQAHLRQGRLVGRLLNLRSFNQMRRAEAAAAELTGGKPSSPLDVGKTMIGRITTAALRSIEKGQRPRGYTWT